MNKTEERMELEKMEIIDGIMESATAEIKRQIKLEGLKTDLIKTVDGQVCIEIKQAFKSIFPVSEYEKTSREAIFLEIVSFLEKERRSRIKTIQQMNEKEAIALAENIISNIEK